MHAACKPAFIAVKPQKITATRRIGGLVFALTIFILQLHCNQAKAQATPPSVAPAHEWVTPPPGDVQRGVALYQARCTACHAVDSNKIGPAHRGVVGRRVGSLPGYKYSDELGRSRLR